MKITRGHILMAVAALALIAVWYISKNKLISETFVVKKKEEEIRIPYEKFSNMQKKIVCDTLKEQEKTYLDTLKKAPTTAEEKSSQDDIKTSMKGLREEMVKAGC